MSIDFSNRSLSFLPHLLIKFRCPWRAVSGVFNSCEASETNLLWSSKASSKSSIIELKTIFILSISSLNPETSALALNPFSFISFIVVINFLSLFIKFLETYIAPIALKINPKIKVSPKVGRYPSIKSSNRSFSLIICIRYSELSICILPVIIIYGSNSINLDSTLFWSYL